MQEDLLRGTEKLMEEVMYSLEMFNLTPEEEEKVITCIRTEIDNNPSSDKTLSINLNDSGYRTVLFNLKYFTKRGTNNGKE